ncbi:retinoic acid receptor responder protein 1 isoform X1 [Ictidomys tridecemlineatus]
MGSGGSHERNHSLQAPGSSQESWAQPRGPFYPSPGAGHGSTLLPRPWGTAHRGSSFPGPAYAERQRCIQFLHHLPSWSAALLAEVGETSRPWGEALVSLAFCQSPNPDAPDELVDPQRGYHINLVFSTESYHLQDGKPRLGKCFARVFFQNQKPRPAITMTCTGLSEKNRTLQEDHLLYEQLKQMKDALTVGGIPDDYGYIDPSVRPIWDLAILGSSYVMWERTTQFSYYYPLQLSRVKQWKTSDHAIDFDYTVLLHEFPTQEIIPCHIHLIWYPGKPLKVKYRCEEIQTPVEASSGTEEGSAVAATEFSNF